MATTQHNPKPRKPARTAKRSRSKKNLLSLEAADALYTRLATVNPVPRTELDHQDAYTLLVAVALSAQATDKGVNKATLGLFAAASTPEAMVALGEDGVAAHIRTIGLWRNKAKNVVALSRLLLERHEGKVPADLEALAALPGVGRKTANVVLNEAFGLPTIAVDTHIFRVANRTGLADGKTPDAIEKGLMAVTPERWLKGAHHWLILHGRYVCVARKPKCWTCALVDICLFKDKSPEPKATKPKSKATGVDP
jgi:endonuclease III